MSSKLSLGKSYVDTSQMVAAVTGGGAYGPGELLRFDGRTWLPLAYAADERSRRLSSGVVRYDTSRPGLYQYVGIAVSNRGVDRGYFEHTQDGQIVKLTGDQMEERLLALYPAFAEAKELRRLHDIERMDELQERELRAMRELTARKAQAEQNRDVLKAHGITLPRLTGTRKQVQWANDIRADRAIRSPTSPELMTQTSAKWWIEHRHGFDALKVWRHLRQTSAHLPPWLLRHKSLF